MFERLEYNFRENPIGFYYIFSGNVNYSSIFPEINKLAIISIIKDKKQKYVLYENEIDYENLQISSEENISGTSAFKLIGKSLIESIDSK